jgi:hypothetical protein
MRPTVRTSTVMPIDLWPGIHARIAGIEPWRMPTARLTITSRAIVQ